MFFFVVKCAPFLFKIEKDLNIDDYKSKSTWKWENSFLNTFEHICLKRVFRLKIMNFENVFLIKVIHFCVI